MDGSVTEASGTDGGGARGGDGEPLAGEPGAGEPEAGEPMAGEPGAGEDADDPRDGGLSARHRAVLALERRNWSGAGAKERAIRERLGLAPVRYYQLLNALLDDPRALAHDPVTVNRLRRVRDRRRTGR